jgi:hypothetical protein
MIIMNITMRLVPAVMDFTTAARTGFFMARCGCFVRPRIFDMPLGCPFHMLRRRRPQTFFMTELVAVRRLHVAAIRFLGTRR